MLFLGAKLDCAGLHCSLNSTSGAAPAEELVKRESVDAGHLKQSSEPPPKNSDDGEWVNKTGAPGDLGVVPTAVTHVQLLSSASFLISQISSVKRFFVRSFVINFSWHFSVLPPLELVQLSVKQKNNLRNYKLFVCLFVHCCCCCFYKGEIYPMFSGSFLKYKLMLEEEDKEEEESLDVELIPKCLSFSFFWGPLSSFGLCVFLSVFLLFRFFSSAEPFTAINSLQSEHTTLHYGVPQGSVLGPVLFILYTQPVFNLVSKHAVSHHAFADDNQLYKISTLDAIHQSIETLQNCTIDVKSWMTANKLQIECLSTVLCRLSFTSEMPMSHLCHSILETLHWLPVTHRIQYKISTVCFNSISGTAPPHLSDLLQPHTPGTLLILTANRSTHIHSRAHTLSVGRGDRNGCEKTV